MSSPTDAAPRGRSRLITRLWVLIVAAIVVVVPIASCFTFVKVYNARHTIDQGEFEGRIKRDLPLGSSEGRVIELLAQQSQRDLYIWYCIQWTAASKPLRFPTPNSVQRSDSFLPTPQSTLATSTPGRLESCTEHPPAAPSTIVVRIKNTQDRIAICTVHFGVDFKISAEALLESYVIVPDSSCW